MIVCQDTSGVRPLRRSRSISFGVFDFADLVENGFEVGAGARREGAGDVFPAQPGRISSIGSFPHFFCDSDGFIEQVRAGTVQSRSAAGHRHILAGRAESNNIHGFQVGPGKRGHISVVFHKGQALRGHPDGKRLDLRSPHRGHAGDQTAERKTARSVEQAAEGEVTAHRGVPPPLQGRCTGSFHRLDPQKYPPGRCRSPRRAGG